jgi:hypothetical protein
MRVTGSTAWVLDPAASFSTRSPSATPTPPAGDTAGATVPAVQSRHYRAPKELAQNPLRIREGVRRTLPGVAARAPPPPKAEAPYPPRCI